MMQCSVKNIEMDFILDPSSGWSLFNADSLSQNSFWLKGSCYGLGTRNKILIRERRCRSYALQFPSLQSKRFFWLISCLFFAAMQQYVVVTKYISIIHSHITMIHLAVHNNPLWLTRLAQWTLILQKCWKLRLSVLVVSRHSVVTNFVSVIDILLNFQGLPSPQLFGTRKLGFPQASK